MAKMSNEQIWNFAREFVKRVYEINEYWFHDEEIRTRDITISLYYLTCLAEAEIERDEEYCVGGECFNDGMYESEEKLEDIIPRIVEDETIEAVMFCEGAMWEMLYYCEGYGSNNERTKAIYKAFLQTAAKHGMWYEWGGGIIYPQMRAFMLSLA